MRYNHENIIKAYDSGEVNFRNKKLPFFVMESASNLNDYIKNEGPQSDHLKIYEFITQVLNGLIYVNQLENTQFRERKIQFFLSPSS